MLVYMNVRWQKYRAGEIYELNERFASQLMETPARRTSADMARGLMIARPATQADLVKAAEPPPPVERVVVRVHRAGWVGGKGFRRQLLRPNEEYGVPPGVAHQIVNGYRAPGGRQVKPWGEYVEEQPPAKVARAAAPKKRRGRPAAARSDMEAPVQK